MRKGYRLNSKANFQRYMQTADFRFGSELIKKGLKGAGNLAKRATDKADEAISGVGNLAKRAGNKAGDTAVNIGSRAQDAANRAGTAISNNRTAIRNTGLGVAGAGAALGTGAALANRRKKNKEQMM